MSRAGTEETETEPRTSTSNDSPVEKLGDSPDWHPSTITDPELRLEDKESESNCNFNCDCDCSHAAELKRDSNGLPLVPQPSQFKDDPLVSVIKLINRQSSRQYNPVNRIVI